MTLVPFARAKRVFRPEMLAALPQAVILAGVLLRLRQYMENRSLWIDEVVNATNILTKSFAQLLLQPMDYNLTAPRGFWIIERSVVRLLGDSEFALRLFPFACALVSLPLFWGTARRYVGFGTALIGLGLFALSNQLAYFSAQVKQYSSDILVSVLLLGLGAWAVRGDQSIRQILLMGIAGAIAIWFSYPAMFILASIGVTWLSSLSRREWKRIARFAIAFSMWGASFLVLYLNSLRAAGNNNVLASQWAGGFMPFPPISFGDWKWLWDHFIALFDDPVGLSLAGVAALAFLIGCTSFLKQSKTKFLLLVLPFAFLLAASAARRYPFGGRVLLFLAPLVLLIVAEGVEQIWSMARDRASFVGIMFAGFVFLPVLFNVFVSPPPEEIRPVMSQLRTNYRVGDVIYLYYGANLAFQYYAPQFGFTDRDYIAGVSSRDAWGKYADQLETLRDNKRVWVVFSHMWTGNGVDEEKLFLYFLDRMGTRVDSFRAAGASLYLYDLQRKQPPSSSVLGTFGYSLFIVRRDAGVPAEQVDEAVLPEASRRLTSRTCCKLQARRWSFAAG